MNLKKLMSEKGPEMVRTAVKGVGIKKQEPEAPKDPKAIPPEMASKLIQEIKANGKVTSNVPLSKIIIEENVRRQFSPQSIKELGESLADVGLLHNVILHVVEHTGSHYFHCISGKRRVLAAESISWPSIEADITLEQDPVESLYIGVIANLHEAVFWLDNALLYSKLSSHGHTDEQIAARVKVNARTVGWFKRLAKMSSHCQKLAYDNPELFNSRWAQHVARHGELPEGDLLEQHMNQMVAQKRTWHTVHTELKERSGASSVDSSEALSRAHQVVTNFKPAQLTQTHNFLDALTKSGFLTQATLKKIQDQFFKGIMTQSNSKKSTQVASHREN